MKPKTSRILAVVMTFALVTMAATSPPIDRILRGGGRVLVNPNGSVTVTNPSGLGTAFSGSITLGNFTVAGLPTGTSGKLAYVTDGANATDCTTGGGSSKVLCGYNGTAWASVVGIATQPKTYIASLTQTAANAPVATVQANTLSGTPTWARTSIGVYTLTLNGEWTAGGKTLITVGTQPTTGDGLWNVYSTVRTSTNVITLTTKQGDVSFPICSISDGLLTETAIRIEVYP